MKNEIAVLFTNGKMRIFEEQNDYAFGYFKIEIQEAKQKNKFYEFEGQFINPDHVVWFKHR